MFDNNGLIEFAFTNYRYDKTKWLMNHVIFISYDIWSLEYTKYGIRVIERDKQLLSHNYDYYFYYNYRIKISLKHSSDTMDILYFNVK